MISALLVTAAAAAPLSVDAIANQDRGAFDLCLAHVLIDNPDTPAGVLEMQVTAGKDGKVEDVEVREHAWGDGFTQCVTRIVEKRLVQPGSEPLKVALEPDEVPVGSLLSAAGALVAGAPDVERAAPILEGLGHPKVITEGHPLWSTVASASDSFADCRELVADQAPRPLGVVEIVLDGTHTVAMSTVARSDLRSLNVIQCVTQTWAGRQFPEGTGRYSVLHSY